MSVDIDRLRGVCSEAAASIDGVLPSSVRRVGPLRVSVSFDGDRALWTAGVSYRASRRRSVQETSGQYADTPDLAVANLVEMIVFMSEHRDKGLF